MFVASPLIASEYAAFLRGLGVSDTSEPSDIDIDEFYLSPRLISASLTGNLGQLNDQEIAEYYSALSPRNVLKIISLSEKLAQFTALNIAMPQTASSVVEFGGGTGLLSVFLAKHLGWEMTNVDVCDEYLRFCQALAKSEEVEVQTIQSFAHETHLMDGAFDLAFCIDLIDCSENWAQIVREMARVSKSVILIYCITSGFRHIEPNDVIGELDAQGLRSSLNILNPSHFIGGDDNGARWAVISANQQP